jgi:hypothetical protein
LTARSQIAAPEPWLEIIEGESPLLLIAPHGGRAAAATRAILHPKVNDLHTADITRELARRMNATALINSGMDRNLIDCNRVPQLIERAPWMFDLIARALERVIGRHGRAVVLLIHGWNIIEPRVDLGIGVRTYGAELRPAGSARVSAGDEFIHGPLAHFAARLSEFGIKPTFGMRYPAGGANNLLQAFTPRHREHAAAPVRRLAALAADGRIDSAQFELSVAVRMPGELRERCIDSIEESFFRNGHVPVAPAVAVNRTPRPRPPVARPAATPQMPARIGIEFYDPTARIGAMASFDIAAGTGARIMILMGRRRAALYTAEGRPVFRGGGVELGPLALRFDARALELSFNGPGVVVPDSTAYLSIERALASGRLDGAMRVVARLELSEGELDFEKLLAGATAIAPAANPPASFGILTGEISADGVTRPLRAYARAGLSFTGIGPQRFDTRRMSWACFDEGGRRTALELRTVLAAGAPDYRSARLVSDGDEHAAELRELKIETPSVAEPPASIDALIVTGDGGEQPICGEVLSFIPLSRPGPEQSRIYTALGFARFRMGRREGAGMFEYSQRSDRVARASDSDDDETDAE